MIEYLQYRINALEIENKRLNEELISFKKLAGKVKLTDPNFDKPLSELEIDYSC
jgi:hypothetical protein